MIPDSPLPPLGSENKVKTGTLAPAPELRWFPVAAGGLMGGPRYSCTPPSSIQPCSPPVQKEAWKHVLPDSCAPPASLCSEPVRAEKGSDPICYQLPDAFALAASNRNPPRRRRRGGGPILAVTGLKAHMSNCPAGYITV
ncbi:unnamed protein product [Pleuronectes platessa]|uniref:Uncharacterized protein n=1 Tax=Pleuronectes platessa TaxID=8262 RepID=A0A9N7W143_PLEPL|nr:unnamed protein product [Pleuronectes platessa]